MAPTENGNGLISWALNLDTALTIWTQMKTMKNGQAQTSLLGWKRHVLSSWSILPVSFSARGGGSDTPQLAGRGGQVEAIPGPAGRCCSGRCWHVTCRTPAAS